MKRILLIADFFGRWPDWAHVYFASCAANPTVDWLIHTDCGPRVDVPPNVRIVPISLDDYCSKVSLSLDINFKPVNMYSVCNIRPAMGVIHAEEISNYDYFGWTDIDLVYGDIRRFLGGAVLERDIVTTSGRICSGHFTLVRNSEALRTAYQFIPNWRERMAASDVPPWHESLDEAWFSRLCSPHGDLRRQLIDAGVPERHADTFRGNNHFASEWTTPFVPGAWLDGRPLHPEIWYWRPGSLTNDRDGDRQFPYLHLMNFKARRWIDPELYGCCSTWDERCEIAGVSRPLAPGSALRIDRTGISVVSEHDVSAEIETLERARAASDRLLARGERVPLSGLATQLAFDGESREIRLVDPAGAVPAESRSILWRRKGEIEAILAAGLEA